MSHVLTQKTSKLQWSGLLHTWAAAGPSGCILLWAAVPQRVIPVVVVPEVPRHIDRGFTGIRPHLWLLPLCQAWGMVDYQHCGGLTCVLLLEPPLSVLLPRSHGPRSCSSQLFEEQVSPEHLCRNCELQQEKVSTPACAVLERSSLNEQCCRPLPPWNSYLETPM